MANYDRILAESIECLLRSRSMFRIDYCNGSVFGLTVFLPGWLELFFTSYKYFKKCRWDVQYLKCCCINTFWGQKIIFFHSVLQCCVYPSFAVRFEPRNNVVYTITGAGVAVPAGVLRVPVPLQQAAHHCQPLLGGRGFQNQVNP